MRKTVAEKLSRGVRGQSTEADLFLERLREAMGTALTERGIAPREARTIASGVHRSQLGPERELLPFDPKYQLR